MLLNVLAGFCLTKEFEDTQNTVKERVLGYQEAFGAMPVYTEAKPSKKHSKTLFIV